MNRKLHKCVIESKLGIRKNGGMSCHFSVISNHIVQKNYDLKILIPVLHSCPRQSCSSAIMFHLDKARVSFFFNLLGSTLFSKV